MQIDNFFNGAPAEQRYDELADKLRALGYERQNVTAVGQDECVRLEGWKKGKRQLAVLVSEWGFWDVLRYITSNADAALQLQRIERADCDQDAAEMPL